MKRVFLLAGVALAMLFCQPANADLFQIQLFGIGGQGLLTTNELHNPTGGSGGILTEIIYDSNTMELTMDVGWGSGNGFTDLTGNATAMHIHGPAGINANAGVQIGLDGLGGFNASASNGGLTDSVTLTAAQETMLFGGTLYINVHTATNGPGEIRGNLFVVPEPSGAFFLGILVIAGIGTRKRLR